ncbi:MAG: putative sugar nucleotidyl transferase [Pirellulales bacterium]
MQVLVFEDDSVERLWPLTTFRPACDITVGAQTLCQTLSHIGSVCRVLRPSLATHVDAIADSRVMLWGAAVTPADAEPLMSPHGALTVLVNARAVPSRSTLIAIRSLVEAGHRGIVWDGDAIAGAILHRTSDGNGADDIAIRQLIDTRSTDAITSLELDTLDCSLELLREPYDVITAHEWAIAGNLTMLIDSGRFKELRPGLFAEIRVDIQEPIVVRHGPVLVESGVEIGPFVCFDGPVFIGKDSKINPHTWLHDAIAIGSGCRAGGEIESSVMEPFSNKPHDGFIGHSHVGSWTNLAAGTVTGNLKVSYGTIKLQTGDTSIDSGRQFLGSLIGDCVKTAVNTSLPCGARIGSVATVGGATGQTVPAFHNQLIGGEKGSTTSVSQASITLDRMMARRGLSLLSADTDLLAAHDPKLIDSDRT